MKQPKAIKNLKRVQSEHGYTNAQMVKKINDALPRPILPTEQAYCKLKNVKSSNRYVHRQNAMLNCLELALRVIDRRQR